jgi:hypothetical protein
MIVLFVLLIPPCYAQEGSCFECIGEVKGTLNTCDLDAPSCVSSQNDDESHFVAPWMYDGSPSEAADLLVSVATGTSDCMHYFIYMCTGQCNILNKIKDRAFQESTVCRTDLDSLFRAFFPALPCCQVAHTTRCCWTRPSAARALTWRASSFRAPSMCSQVH